MDKLNQSCTEVITSLFKYKKILSGFKKIVWKVEIFTAI